MFNKYFTKIYYIIFWGLSNPSFTIMAMYIFVLSIFIVYNLRKNNLILKFISLSNKKQGYVNKIIGLVTGYVIMIFICINASSVLDEKSIVFNISNIYLQYETLLYFAVFLFLCSVLLNTINKDTQILISNRVIQCLVWFSVGTGLLVGEIDYSLQKNVVFLILGGILNFLFMIVEIKTVDKNIKKPDKFDLISYNSVQNKDELFPRHREQAEDIADIIYTSSVEPFSICLSGKWGSGKTSVIKGVIDILDTPENDYEFIYINALELDNKQAMLNYLMNQIKEKLRARGAYVGLNSEYKEFIASSAGSITTISIGSLVQKVFSKGEDDYRYQKEQLEEVIQRSFNNGKLIIIVDDIERCNKETAREYLFLIKEIATMKNCVSIFITDYDVLNNVVVNENVLSDSPCFFDKFFNYRFFLQDETPQSILNFYDKSFSKTDPAFDSIYRMVAKSPGTWYNEIINGLNKKIELLKTQRNKLNTQKDDEKLFEKNIEDLNECFVLFEKLMKNPRNVAKFYNVFRNNTHRCAKTLFSHYNEKEVHNYISSRNIGQVLYVLSFAEVCLPSEYQQLIKYGAGYVVRSFWRLETIENTEKRLLVELVEGLVFGEFFDFEKPTTYIKEDIQMFINTYLNSKNDLCQLINTFTTEEELWLKAIKDSDEQLILEHWDNMILMVLRKVPNEASGITNLWRNETFTKLLNFAEKQVKNGKWTTDKVFSIFDSKSHTDRLFAIGTGLIQTFWKHINNSKIYQKPTAKYIDELKYFCNHFSYSRIGSTYRLALYLIPFDDENIIKAEKLQEVLLNSNRSYIENIDMYLNEFMNIVPDLYFSCDNWYEKFNELTYHIKEFIKNHNFADYPDVKDEIEHMVDSADEFRALELLMNWCQIQSQNDILDFSIIDTNNLNDIIKYFKNTFNNQMQNDIKEIDIDKRFNEFFRCLLKNDNLELTEQQINTLHELISVFVSLSGYSSFQYRRILINISQKNNTPNTSDGLKV